MSNLIHAAVVNGAGQVRGNNEDAFYLNGQYIALDKMDAGASLSCDCGMDNALFAVCDGVGGHHGGEMASYTAVSEMRTLQDELRHEDFYKAMPLWTDRVNSLVAERTEGGGSTLAMVHINGGYVRIAHIGDSRVYRWHDGELVRMTSDHSKVQLLLDVGAITPEEAKKHPHRHMITRYIGMTDLEPGQVIASICCLMPIFDGDRYVLCSDGITDMLTDEQIQGIIEEKESAAECAQAMYDAAMAAGGRDNATIIVLELEVNEPLKYNNSIPHSERREETAERTSSPELPYRAVETQPVRVQQECNTPRGGRMVFTSEVSGFDNNQGTFSVKITTSVVSE